jgi:hypothetical protein
MENSPFLPEGEADQKVVLAELVARDAPPDARRQTLGLCRFLYTHNPLYAISAGLMLWGLRVSFDARGQSPETDLLMAGLTGYTVLLAAAAWALVRFGKLWDDVRTVLLVIVLLFLVISVTFDDSLVANSAEGIRYFLGGLAFALVVSEGLLRGMPLVLGARFRLPFYLILALFFVYPVALSPFVDKPNSPELHWRCLDSPSSPAPSFSRYCRPCGEARTTRAGGRSPGDGPCIPGCCSACWARPCVCGPTFFAGRSIRRESPATSSARISWSRFCLRSTCCCSKEVWSDAATASWLRRCSRRC